MNRVGCGFRCRKAAQQQAEAVESGVDVAVVAVGVANVGEIAFVPDFAHEVSFR